LPADVSGRERLECGEPAQLRDRIKELRRQQIYKA
jgi:hypothetical protein